MSVPPAICDALRDLFRSSHINNVAIIDDAYDPVPTRSSFSPQALNELAERIRSWEKPATEFSSLNLKIETETDVSDTVIESLYHIRGTSAEVKGWFQDYDNVQEQRRAPLRALETLLHDDLQCIVGTLSPLAQLNSASLPQLIFIDYYLDPSDRVENSLLLAKTIGERVATSFTEIPKPLIVLMSSKETVSDIMKSQFRDQAGFLGGMFYFIPKQELKRDVTLMLRLAVLIRSLADGGKIQDFVETFEKDLRTATQKFSEKVRGLSIEDYAYMQKLTLQGEGMPLGDYLLWLFGTYFAHLLFRSVPKQRRQLDRLRFAHIPESDGMPSAEFVDLYRNVVAEEVDELGVHPRASQEASENPETSPPDPHFGDVFVGDNKEVRMVITAECDLMYAPEAGAERKHRPDQTIVFVPGTLEEIAPVADSEDSVTCFFPLEDKTYQIRWRVKSTGSVRFDTLRAAMQEGGFHRRARMRHPFATQVQASFTNDFGRVGIPVPPPMLRKASASVFCQGDDGNPESHASSPAFLYIDRAEGEEHAHLKLQCVVSIIQVAQKASERITQKLATEPEGNTRLRLTSHQDRLTRFLGDLETQTALRQPFALKLGGTYPFPDCPIEAIRDVNKLKQRLNSVPVVVLIVEEAAIEEPETLATAPEEEAAGADPPANEV